MDLELDRSGGAGGTGSTCGAGVCRGWRGRAGREVSVGKVSKKVS